MESGGERRKPLEIKGIRFGGGRPVVCVPVVARERADVVGKIRELVSKKVQMIEWRADCFGRIDDPEEVRGLLAEIRPLTSETVMLFTIRSEHQGGCARLDEKALLRLDEIAAKSGSMDLVDLEYFELERPDREIRRLQKTGMCVIASHHDFSGTPEDVILHKVMEQLCQSGADLAKLAVMPHSAEDLVRLLRLTVDTGRNFPDLPLLAVAMGGIGIPSRLAGEIFGSCITFGADGENSAPGQIRADKLGEFLDLIHEGLEQDPRRELEG